MYSQEWISNRQKEIGIESFEKWSNGTNKNIKKYYIYVDKYLSSIGSSRTNENQLYLEWFLKNYQNY